MRNPSVEKIAMQKPYYNHPKFKDVNQAIPYRHLTTQETLP